MDEPYYTDAMRAAVAAVPNKHGFQFVLQQMSDDEGPYLVMTFDHDEYTKFGYDNTVARDVAEYIVNVHTALRQQGARVTYLIVDSAVGS